LASIWCLELDNSETLSRKLNISYGLNEARKFKINLPFVIHGTVAVKNSLSYTVWTYGPVANLIWVFCISVLLHFTYCGSHLIGHVLLRCHLNKLGIELKSINTPMLSYCLVPMYLCNVYWTVYYQTDFSFINWSEHMTISKYLEKCFI
jgi:hypothetical protein